MNSTKALEMLNNGKIEDLKKALQDDIYAESLKRVPGAKQRYAAMKRYFKYSSTARESLMRPCKVVVEGEDYTSFCNSYSLVLTVEDTGEMQLFDESMGTYPDVARLIFFDGKEGEIDFNKVFAEAKSKGYKLKQNEVNGQAHFYMHYQGAYYKIGLIDISYNIINDGKPATAYKKEGPYQKLTVTSDYGTAVIMPVRLEQDPEECEVIFV